MSRDNRHLCITAVWVAALVILSWILIPQPPHDDEYTRWLFVSILFFGLPWYFDSLVVLLIAFSLEQRMKRVRLWILGWWAVILGLLVWTEVFRPAFRFPPGARKMWLIPGLQLFAFPKLTGLLIALWFALWVEKKAAERSLSS